MLQERQCPRQYQSHFKFYPQLEPMHRGSCANVRLGATITGRERNEAVTIDYTNNGHVSGILKYQISSTILAMASKLEEMLPSTKSIRRAPSCQCCHHTRRSCQILPVSSLPSFHFLFLFPVSSPPFTRILSLSCRFPFPHFLSPLPLQYTSRHF